MKIYLPEWFGQGRVRHITCTLLLLACWLPLGAQTPLPLPFFDDFSSVVTVTAQPGVSVPSPARWQPGSGVYVNNTMAINHPTAGVVSFDGLAANGRPYVQNNRFAQGYTDTLQSRPITLAGLAATDKIFLSFYWQMRGGGELPDPGDSLTVQFLDNTGAWRTVWQVENKGDSLKIRTINDTGRPDSTRQLNGPDYTRQFFQAFVPVVDSRFFHAGFAFRFRTYGRESGPFDTWNVDYVYLNKNRSRTDRFVKDVAVRQALSPLLKRYTAMPLSQYVLNPAAETADSVTTDINNLFNNFNFTTFRFTVRDEVSGRLVQDSPSANSSLIPALSAQRKVAAVAPVNGLGTATRALLRYKFDLNTTDDQNPSIAGVNLRQNDTLSAVAVLDNYFAYDDGSWEFAQQIGQREQVAMRFFLNKPDIIAGVRACIVPFLSDQTGQSFVINVYSNKKGKPDQTIYQKAFKVQYPATRNGFVEFPFDRGVSVKDTFYVGYRQITSSDTTQFRLGFDKNSPFGREIFYNGGTNWEQNQQSAALNVTGAFMLRPVMGGKPDSIVTALPEPLPLSELRVYPNPTTGQIRWDMTNLLRLDVIDLRGRLLLTIQPARGQQTTDLGHLPTSMYLLRLTDEKRTIVQKLIVQP